ncbi:hypothetical protein J1614_003028 [Plenodomus biglobosus]|nr:hypothetical protein J1614_003028 [Plenodomus biglobosus]
MATKSNAAPNTAVAPAKPTRPKTATNKPKMGQERGGSLGDTKDSIPPVNKTTTAAKLTTTTTQLPRDVPLRTAAKTRRKPRKLNQDTTSDPRLENASPLVAAISTVQDPMAELDALKSRIRGLEAKVEALYESGTKLQPSRSSHRRGKGRKISPSNRAPALNTPTVTINARDEDHKHDAQEEEADEELVRLEGELEVARRDLDSYSHCPHTRRTSSWHSNDGIEEIPTDVGNVNTIIQGDKQVTLSGSYRIPIPTSVSIDDVKTIKSGVSAAQNVARTFLEQRRAAVAAMAEQNQNYSTVQQTSSTSALPARSKAGSPSIKGTPKDAGGTQSWGDWIGGYSLAITKVVKSIEHEATMESQSGSATSTQSGRTPGAPNKKKNAGKRSPPMMKLSSEQVHGLMN